VGGIDRWIERERERERERDINIPTEAYRVCAGGEGFGRCVGSCVPAQESNIVMQVPVKTNDNCTISFCEFPPVQIPPPPRFFAFEPFSFLPQSYFPAFGSITRGTNLSESAALKLAASPLFVTPSFLSCPLGLIFPRHCTFARYLFSACASRC
jgi:hypothetical protein